MQGNTQQRKVQLSHEYLTDASVSNNLRCGSEVCQNFNDVTASAATLLRKHEPMSHILTEDLNIVQTEFIDPGMGQYAVINLSSGNILKSFR
jgi:hypothetical protein